MRSQQANVERAKNERPPTVESDNSPKTIPQTLQHADPEQPPRTESGTAAQETTRRVVATATQYTKLYKLAVHGYKTHCRQPQG